MLIGFAHPAVSVILYAVIAVYYVYEHLPDPSSAVPGAPAEVSAADSGGEAESGGT